ncbi:MAG: right-handed parallel beta-helix repeat-containing protein, partial [Planctomycetota bacterium]
MCKKLVCLVTFIVVVGLVGIAHGTDYYIDSVGGDDGNPGTSPSQAWRTLTKVNNTSFAPGDSILFKYDCQWDGQLILSSSGSAGNPIIIDRYGGTSSKPRIDGNGTDGGGSGSGGTVLLDNIEYIEVHNLEITNEAASRGSKRYGVLVNARDGDPWKVHIVLKNLYIHNVNGTLTKDTTGEGAGIQVECNAGTYIDGLIIEDCHLKTTDRNGIATHAPQWARPDQGCINTVVRGNLIEDCGGDAIKFWGFFDALAEYNVVNGHHMRATDAACGIWPFKSDRTVIQFNEVYGSVHTKDGQAFDIDDFTLDTTIQYNYSHDNVGGFLLICALNT